MLCVVSCRAAPALSKILELSNIRRFSVADSFAASVAVAMRVDVMVVAVVMMEAAAVGGENLMNKFYRKVLRDFSQWTDEFPSHSKVSRGL